MTDSKKSASSASKPQFMRSEARTNVNPPNMVPRANKARSQRYLYGGMLYPSRIVSAKETQTVEGEN